MGKRRRVKRDKPRDSTSFPLVVLTGIELEVFEKTGARTRGVKIVKSVDDEDEVLANGHQDEDDLVAALPL